MLIFCTKEGGEEQEVLTDEQAIRVEEEQEDLDKKRMRQKRMMRMTRMRRTRMRSTRMRRTRMRRIRMRRTGMRKTVMSRTRKKMITRTRMSVRMRVRMQSITSVIYRKWQSIVSVTVILPTLKSNENYPCFLEPIFL